ncbi:MAG: hypothetical protein P4N60_05200 [Verrucomicrobiae bacterium]|nr:hypothetical protein [Verrucomicrobiae bacterium]
MANFYRCIKSDSEFALVAVNNLKNACKTSISGVGIAFAIGVSVAVVVNLGGEQEDKRVSVGMYRLFFS